MFARLGLREGAPATSLTAPCVLNALATDLQGVVGEITVMAGHTAESVVAVELVDAALENPAATVSVELPASDQGVSSKEFSQASMWVHFEATVVLTRGRTKEPYTGVFTLTEGADDGTFRAKVTIRDPNGPKGKWL